MPEGTRWRPALIALVLLAAQVVGAEATEPVWIDVRSPAEYAREHLEGTRLVPFDGIEKGVRQLRLDKDTPIYLFCASGGRSELARERLEARGYTRVVNVGGLEDARAALADR